jgi:hypothetical protein
MSGSKFTGPLNMYGLQVEKDLFMSNAEFNEVNLSEATIGSRLEMSDSKFSGLLDMNSLQVDGHLFMRDTPTFMRDAEFNEVNLVGATIGDVLEISGSKFTGFLDMNGLQVRNYLVMSNAEFNGVGLIEGNIGGQLSMIRSKFTGLLGMGSLQIGSHLFMNNAEFSKDVSLVFSNLNGTLDLSSSTFASLDLTGTQIRGELALNGTSWSQGAQLILVNTDVGILHYTEEAWPEKLDLNGFTYVSLKNRAADDRDPFDVSWFKGWLERQEHYSPQPYEQLASVLLKQGYGNKSRDILFASRKREHFEAADWLREILWLPLLYLFTGYGYRMEHAFYAAAALTLLGTIIMFLWGPSPYKRKFWDSIEYSVDRLLPNAIQLHKSSDEPQLVWGVRRYFFLHQLLGFLLAFFIIAGITGLIR